MACRSNILVYRLGSLGDTIIALPCFHLVRRVYPRSKVTLLTNQPVSGKAAPAMAILQNSGLCDEAISYPVGVRNVRQLAELRRMIRQLQPETLINLAAGRGLIRSLRDYLFFRSCAISRIIGTPLRRRDLKVQPITAEEYEPESERLAGRLAALGRLDLADRRLWQLGLTHQERTHASQLLPSGSRNLLAVGVGTKLPVKDWGEDNWQTLLGLISKEVSDTALLLLGSEDESGRSEKLGRLWPGPYLNLCGKCQPRISAAILQRCRLFIGHDSGPMHLAAAVGSPTLGLFSWLNPPGQWFPGHKSWRHIKVLYPALPRTGWRLGLQMRRSRSEGILLLRPEDVSRAAMELWHAPSQEVAFETSHHFLNYCKGASVNNLYK